MDIAVQSYHRVKIKEIKEIKQIFGSCLWSEKSVEVTVTLFIDGALGTTLHSNTLVA